jgi:hypothetical protein
MLEGNVLTIRIGKKPECKEERQVRDFAERSGGIFQCLVGLSLVAGPDRVSVRLENGIPRVMARDRAQGRNRHIQVQSGSTLGRPTIVGVAVLANEGVERWMIRSVVPWHLRRTRFG